MKLAAIIAMLLLVTSAFGQVGKTKASYYSGEVWFSFRERIHENSDEGKTTAPAHESEALPPSGGKQNGTEETSFIQGKVKHLPYLFEILVKEANGKTAFDVKLFGEDGKMITGFPKHIEKKAVQIGNGVSVVIPIDEALEGRITKELLSSDSFLTYVSVVILKN